MAEEVADWQPGLQALYRVEGVNGDGPWTCFVHAASASRAVDVAVSKKAWNVLHGLIVAVEPDFIDDIHRDVVAEGKVA